VKLETIPLTPNGKVDRKSLDAHGTKLGTGTGYIPPGNQTEKILTETWKRVLKLEKISIDDNFFDLGGNSMDVISLNDELKKTFQKNIPVTAIFNYLTIRSFARFLDQQAAPAAVIEKKTDRREEIRRSRTRMMEKMKRIGVGNDRNTAGKR
jgi:acyl carrier protein